MKIGEKAAVVFVTLLFTIYLTSSARAQQFAWAKQIGGTGSSTICIANSMVIDSNKNIYTTGRFSGTVDFDPGPAVSNLTSWGLEDIYISKMDASGNFLWARQMGQGGVNSEGGNSIAVDNFGNVYATGIFSGTADFDPGPDTFNLISAGGLEIFINKLDSVGNFLWAKQLGGMGFDYGYSITVDCIGNVYTTGFFTSIGDFDPGPGTFYLYSGNYEGLFVSKLDSSGNFVWAKQMSGTGSANGLSIKVDCSGNLYTTGWFEGTVDFDPGSFTFNLTSLSLNSKNIFVCRLDTSGNFVWAKMFACLGPNYSIGISIAVDGSGNVYTTGGLVGTVDFDPGLGTYYITSVGYGDVFVNKLDALGNLVWAKAIGGPNNDYGKSIAVDGSGNVYTTGFFDLTADFDPGPATYNLTTAGMQEIFIIKLDSSGNFTWANQMGGIDQEEGNSIALDSFGNIYTTGQFKGNGDYNPGPSTYNLFLGGYVDSYLLKLRQCLSSTNTISPIVCGSYISPSGNLIWTSSGTYLDTIPNAVGCDSVITVNLTINNSASVIAPSACDSFISPSGNYMWTSTGTFHDTIPNAGGCDSVITINLTINNSASVIVPTVCDSFISPSGNYIWTSSGTYNDTIPNVAGCDSVITVNLTIHNSGSNISSTACGSYTSPSGNFIWTSSGFYQDTVPNAAGCDSVITVNLTIQLNDTSVTVSSGTLIANANGAAYQWLNCDSNYVEITGATAQTYTPVMTGNYAVQITQNGCTDTSYCYNCIPTGIYAVGYSAKIIIQPNPFSAQAVLKASFILQNATLTVYDIFGQTIKQIIGIYEQQIILNRDNLSAGIFLVRLTEGNKIIAVEKLIIIDN